MDLGQLFAFLGGGDSDLAQKVFVLCAFPVVRDNPLSGKYREVLHKGDSDLAFLVGRDIPYLAEKHLEFLLEGNSDFAGKVIVVSAFEVAGDLHLVLKCMAFPCDWSFYWVKKFLSFLGIGGLDLLMTLIVVSKFVTARVLFVVRKFFAFLYTGDSKYVVKGAAISVFVVRRALYFAGDLLQMKFLIL